MASDWYARRIDILLSSLAIFNPLSCQLQGRSDHRQPGRSDIIASQGHIVNELQEDPAGLFGTLRASDCSSYCLPCRPVDHRLAMIRGQGLRRRVPMPKSQKKKKKR